MNLINKKTIVNRFLLLFVLFATTNVVEAVKLGGKLINGPRNILYTVNGGASTLWEVLKMKKIAGIVFTSFCLVGCGNLNSENPTKSSQVNQKKYYNYSDGLDTKKVDKVTINADHAIDISDVAKLRDFEMNVFIGTVESIDGASTTVANGVFNPTPYIYGKISVLSNLKGETKANTIDFARQGGIISVEEYEKFAPKEMVENNEKHRKSAGQERIDKANTYLDFTYENDIKLEAGKTYLFFSMYDENTGVYAIDGVQYGTRELYQTETKAKVFSSMPDIKTLQIKDNETGKYESFEKLLDAYF